MVGESTFAAVAVIGDGEIKIRIKCKSRGN